MKDIIKDVAVEIFRIISGKFFVKGSDKVPAKYRASLFVRLCEILKCRAAYPRYLTTVDQFACFFERVLRRKQKFMEKLYQQIHSLVLEMSGTDYGLDGIIYNELYPKAVDPVLRCREQMNYSLKLDKVKTAIRNKYNYWEYSFEFYFADTVRKIAEAVYWKPYVLSTL